MKSLTLALLTLALGTSCSDDQDDNPNGQLRLSAKATFTSGSASKSPSAGKTINADLEVSEFLINLKEFELELDDDAFEFDDDDFEGDDDLWDDDGYLDFDDEIELEGPFELDLMAGQITFINTTLPNGKFEELEFKFDRSDDPQSELFGKSVLIRGTISQIPFEFWHDFEDEVEIDFDDPTMDIVISTGVESLVLDFDLSLLFNSISGIDLTQATDGNEDGVIEISPQDPDGNNALANEIRNRMKDLIDLLDD
ncbi:hypothetical protein [Robiginitalea marina]|uniref:DUF4382 domain-containing protein n=1 Tax=Robiginitalea marina TaxID=2954105 RepID=A0ABT1AXZ1_9FLAO|nr:hypothetical protein [Robiginitalea marina]MCO5724781.1 hypothetical protein [Robiginitalea marina]